MTVTPDDNQTSNGTIIVEPSGGQAPYEFIWAHDPLETSNTLTNLSAGDYTVGITDANFCFISETITVDQLTNTQDLNDSVRFLISPNPNNGIFTIDFGFSNPQNWDLQLANSLGQVIRKVTAPIGGTAFSKLEVDLPNGVYWISLSVDGKIIRYETVVVE